MKTPRDRGRQQAPAPTTPVASAAPPAAPSRERWILLAIVLLALGVRVTYFLQLRDSPCLDQHRWAQTDMHYFDAWGRAIAGGDWLSATVSAPMHAWHVDVATEYLAAHPERRAEMLARSGAASEGPADKRRLAQELWLHWLGGRTFYQDPFYPYLIGLTYSICGPDVRWVFAWQMGMGVGTCVLVFLLTRRWFGSTVAATAGLSTALCAPLLYHELVLVRETAIVFLGFLVVHAILRALDRAAPMRWFVVGSLLGLGVLLKSTFVLFTAGVVVGLAVARWRRHIGSSRSAMAAVVGLVLVLLPAIARNVALGVAPLGLASSGALTFVSHNAADYDASIGGFHVSEHVGRILGDTDGRFLPAAVETLGTHTGASYLRQVAAKLANTFSWFETPDNANFYLYRHFAWILWVPVSTWWIASLALVGLWAVVRRPRVDHVGAPLWPVHVLVGTSLVSLLAFVVTSRVRLPFVAALIPFAALGAVHVLRWLRHRRGPGGAVAIAVLLGAVLFVGRAPGSGAAMFRVADVALTGELTWEPRIRAALERQDLVAAEAAFGSALRQVRDEVVRIGAERIEHRAVVVEGTLAIGLFAGPYTAALARAESAADWSQAAAVLASFLNNVPPSIAEIGTRLPAGASTRMALLNQAGVYARLLRDCAAIHERAGKAAAAAPFAARAEAIEQVLRRAR